MRIQLVFIRLREPARNVLCRVLVSGAELSFGEHIWSSIYMRPWYATKHLTLRIFCELKVSNLQKYNSTW